MKLAITISNGQITGVYLDSLSVGNVDLEVLNYDSQLTPHDEQIEEQIDNRELVRVS